MNIQILWNEAAQRFSVRWTVVTGLALGVVFVTAVGCQSAQVDSAAAVAATQPPAAATRQPTATVVPTETPLPTLTPAPPTPTPEPSATPTPTRVPTPEVVTIPYMDLETDRNPAAMPQWLKIYRPAGVVAPYPTIFLLPDLVFNQATDYRGVVKEFLARGYAVVLVKYQDSTDTGNDPFLRNSELASSLGWTGCALAWTTTYGADYDLDLDRLVVFSHSAEGTSAAAMPLYDETMWAEVLVDCAYPVPAAGAVKGVVTFDAVLGIPDSNLQKFSSKWAQSLSIPQPEILGMIEALNATPPQDWSRAGVLDEATHNRLARTLPLYWVYKTSAEGTVTPSYFLIYDRGVKDIFEYAPEAEGMAQHMRTAGIDVTQKVLQNLNGGWELTDPSTDVAERVVEAADTFISELLQ